jgi:hypothetical protein
MRARLLSLEIQRGCEGRQTASVLGQEGRFGAEIAPESQTLIIEPPPDTIFAPSGENCTDMMAVGSALLFSALRSSVAAREGKKRQLGREIGDFEAAAHPNPRL